ncbi:MAG TPA: PQQ-binding-like beta-propeller repeat protein, partial [Verrucomicrobiae bacterium]|nr:PQQ-binding-like beta-propeller repeat protein [Verrucomicrobiae bacterium]
MTTTIHSKFQFLRGRLTETKFRLSRFNAALVVLGVIFSSSADAASRGWPQWRGPLANGSAPDANPPVQWSETKNVKWKVKLPGYGTSTPIIWNDRVFIQTAIDTGKSSPKAMRGTVGPNVAGLPQAPATPPGDGGTGRRRGPGGGGGRSEAPAQVHQFVLMAMDGASGRTVWEKVVREEVPHEGHHRDHGFSSSSPITDGQHIYAYFGSRGLHCYDLAGNLKWQKDLGRMSTRNGFGEGSSPALHGGVIVINWDHEGEDFIAAFDKTNGRELWRNKRDELTTWTTPLVVEHAGKAQVVVPASAMIRSYDLQTGAELWRCSGMTGNVVPTAVADFGMVYCTSGFRGAALLAIKLGRTGDLTMSDAIAWQHQKGTPYVPSPLLAGERIYFLSGNNGVLSCFDAKSGKAIFEAERLGGISGVYASPVAAGGRVYLLGRTGSAVVVQQSDKLEVLATNVL